MDSPSMYEALPPDGHSGVGLASFAISIFNWVGSVVAFGFAAYFGTTASSSAPPPHWTMVVLGLAIIGLIFLSILGAILGIGGLCQSNRKRLFAGVGLGINLLVFLGWGAVMVIGLVGAP